MTSSRSPRLHMSGVALTVFAALALSSCWRSDEGEPVLDLTDKAVGNCLDLSGEDDFDVTRLTVVPCVDVHTHEIYAITVTTAETYPGLEKLETEAQVSCLGEFEDYVGVSPFDSQLFFSWLVPTLDSWERAKDRQIICILGQRNAEGTGSELKGPIGSTVP